MTRRKRRARARVRAKLPRAAGAGAASGGGGGARGDAIARLGLLASLDDARAAVRRCGRGGVLAAPERLWALAEAALFGGAHVRDGRPPPRVASASLRLGSPRAPVRGDAGKGGGHEPLAKRRRPRVRAGARGESTTERTLMRAERDEARASLS